MAVSHQADINGMAGVAAALLVRMQLHLYIQITETGSGEEYIILIWIGRWKMENAVQTCTFIKWCECVFQPNVIRGHY